MEQNDDGCAVEMQEDGGGHGFGTPMAEEQIKDIEVSLGRIHMLWLHTLLVLYGPGADEAGVIPEGGDESPNTIDGPARMMPTRSRRSVFTWQTFFAFLQLQEFSLRILPVDSRRVDSSALVFSLSSHRHSFIGFVFSPRFVDS
jgi:hypothetical protein